MMFAKIKNKWFKDADGDFEQGGEINEKTSNRNNIITVVTLLILATTAFAIYQYTRPTKTKKVVTPPVEFGVIIEPEFTEKDNQSALSVQQNLLSGLQKQVDDLIKTMSSQMQTTDRKIENARKETARLVEQQVRAENQETEARLKARIAELEARTMNQTPSTQPGTGEAINSPDTFGEYKLPPRPIGTSYDNPDAEHMQYNASEQNRFDRSTFDTHEFVWDNDDENNQRTVENYVPTGSFVTAVVTGGADTNAGVMGPGDTTPVVFQTVNQGILPNGEKSRLKNCTITASAYGEISSSRGITRTNRISCIFPNGGILDIPVKGTAFNFGRNGIRGTTILKNGKIVQMAGISGILTGLGETGEALSQTTSTSALGSTTTLSGQDAALNLLGNASSAVGSKLADYYIKLAEMYHPIVEINPGAIVNIVFLEGFPLDPLMADEYERRTQEQETMASQSNTIMDVISNTPVNPIAKELSNAGITVPKSPFGR